MSCFRRKNTLAICNKASTAFPSQLKISSIFFIPCSQSQNKQNNFHSSRWGHVSGVCYPRGESKRPCFSEVPRHKKEKEKEKKDVNGKCIFHKDKSSPHSVFPLLLALLKTAQDTIMFNRQQTERKKKQAV